MGNEYYRGYFNALYNRLFIANLFQLNINAKSPRHYRRGLVIMLASLYRLVWHSHCYSFRQLFGEFPLTTYLPDAFLPS